MGGPPVARRVRALRVGSLVDAAVSVCERCAHDEVAHDVACVAWGHRADARTDAGLVFSACLLEPSARLACVMTVRVFLPLHACEARRMLASLPRPPPYLALGVDGAPTIARAPVYSPRWHAPWVCRALARGRGVGAPAVVEWVATRLQRASLLAGGCALARAGLPHDLVRAGLPHDLVRAVLRAAHEAPTDLVVRLIDARAAR